MSSVLKSSVLSLGLLAGVGMAAQAQSVSTLPPNSPATAPTAVAPPTSSTRIGPNPGAGSSWQEERYQPAPNYSADASQHPYSTSIGPKPGAHSSGGEENYKATDADNAPARHPYTANMGPRPH
jgi:hypothetical protein